MIEDQGIQQAILNKLDYLDLKYETIVKVLWDMVAVGQAQNQEDRTPGSEAQRPLQTTIQPSYIWTQPLRLRTRCHTVCSSSLFEISFMITTRKSTSSVMDSETEF